MKELSESELKERNKDLPPCKSYQRDGSEPIFPMHRFRSRELYSRCDCGQLRLGTDGWPECFEEVVQDMTDKHIEEYHNKQEEK
jgi:hypothetical protein